MPGQFVVAARVKGSEEGQEGTGAGRGRQNHTCRRGQQGWMLVFGQTWEGGEGGTHEHTRGQGAGQGSGRWGPVGRRPGQSGRWGWSRNSLEATVMARDRSEGQDLVRPWWGDQVPGPLRLAAATHTSQKPTGHIQGWREPAVPCELPLGAHAARAPPETTPAGEGRQAGRVSPGAAPTHGRGSSTGSCRHPAEGTEPGFGQALGRPPPCRAHADTGQCWAAL